MYFCGIREHWIDQYSVLSLDTKGDKRHIQGEAHTNERAGHLISIWFLFTQAKIQTHMWMLVVSCVWHRRTDENTRRRTALIEEI